MTTIARFSLAAIFSTLLMGLAINASASNESGAAAVVNKAAIASAPQTKDFDEIVSLRLRINTHNEVRLLQKRVVSGAWGDTRNIPVGSRLYYEVVDHSGNVVAKGYRKDPRNLHGGRNIDFLLTAPYNVDCASVNLYSVDYENGGKGGYSRDYSLLGSFDIREPRTAQLN